MTQTVPISFEHKLALYSAPALLGYKPANLFSLSRQEYDIEFYAAQFRQEVGDCGLELRVLCTCSDRALLLVFQKSLLQRQLEQPQERGILLQYGYGADWSVERCLARLALRVSLSHGFPHEIGIFLGYPVEDVLGFIQNQGESYKLCGCWKVYHNPEQAQRTFAQYNQCKNHLCSRLEQGESLYQILRQAE